MCGEGANQQPFPFLKVEQLLFQCLGTCSVGYRDRDSHRYTRLGGTSYSQTSPGQAVNQLRVIGCFFGQVG